MSQCGQGTSEPLSEPLVIKFGGTSVGGGPEFIRAARMAADEALNRPVAVVVSAMSGTTDTLLGYAETTAAGDTRTSAGATREGSLAELHRTLSERHLAAARHAVGEEHLPRVKERIHELLGGLLEAIGSGYENLAFRRAEILIHGERLSACILAGAIASAGVPASVAGDPIATDEDHTEAEVDPERTRERAAEHVVPLLEKGEVAIVPGFVGRSPEDCQTTLGRGGSDLSAAALGAALGSREVWICSDVDGVLDADPALVSKARLIPRLSYREASSIAGLGAKVLHPKTMQPARAAGMEVIVRNTFNRGCAGTRVGIQETGSGVRGLGIRHGLSLKRGAKKPDSPVFRVLGSGGSGVDYLIQPVSNENADSAAVVCVGAPDCGELAAGISALEKNGIPLRWAGLCSDGLLFVVENEMAEEALETLYGALLDPTETEEIAETSGGKFAGKSGDSHSVEGVA